MIEETLKILKLLSDRADRVREKDREKLFKEILDIVKEAETKWQLMNLNEHRDAARWIYQRILDELSKEAL